MPADPLRLRALAQTAIEDATAKLNAGGSLAAWEKEMRAIIARAHTAAHLAGMADKSAGGKVREFFARLVGERALPKADRAAIKEAVSAQLKYFDDFAAAASDMTPEARAARARLYAGATRGTYYKSATEADLPAYPGDGSSECLGNCGCSWVQDGDSYTWVRSLTDSCATCIRREREWSPYTGGGE